MAAWPPACTQWQTGQTDASEWRALQAHGRRRRRKQRAQRPVRAIVTIIKYPYLSTFTFWPIINQGPRSAGSRWPKQSALEATKGGPQSV